MSLEQALAYSMLQRPLDNQVYVEAFRLILTSALVKKCMNAFTLSFTFPRIWFIIPINHQRAAGSNNLIERKEGPYLYKMCGERQVLAICC